MPRLINVICERALLGGYAHDATTLDAHDVDRAAREALAPGTPMPPRWRWMAAAAAVVVACALVIFWPRTPEASADAHAAPPLPAVATAKPKPAARVPRLDADALSARIAEPASTSSQAWAQLLALWHSSADVSIAMACAPSVAPGLYCVRGRATLDRLVAQQRPAMLRLQADGHPVWALLLGADALRVRLQLGANVVDVDRVALQRAWQGDYVALWRGPQVLALPLTSDGRGPAVDWVRAQLRPRYAGPAVLDAAMTDAVRAFQKTQGLDTDGVIGPETLMALSARQPGPTLRTRLD